MEIVVSSNDNKPKSVILQKKFSTRTIMGEEIKVEQRQTYGILRIKAVCKSILTISNI